MKRLALIRRREARRIARDAALLKESEYLDQRSQPPPVNAIDAVLDDLRVEDDQEVDGP